MAVITVTPFFEKTKGTGSPTPHALYHFHNLKIIYCAFTHDLSYEIDAEDIDTRRSTRRSNKVILSSVMSHKKSNTTHIL